MRTTITLDDDVFLTVKKKMREDGTTFKETVNELIRNGRYLTEEKKPLNRFKLKGRLLKPKLPFNFDKVNQLLEEIEGTDLK